MTNNHNNLKSSGTSYKCMDCGYIWHYDDDACPECGSVECCDWNKPVNRNKDANDIDVVKMAEEFFNQNCLKHGKGWRYSRDLIRFSTDFAQFYHEQEMKNIWRELSVEPDLHRLHEEFVVLTNGGMILPAFFYKADEYISIHCERNNGIKWAYVNDLIPTELKPQER